MKINLNNYLRSVWSSTCYESAEITEFAHQKSIDEARKGLGAMSILIIAILLIEATLYIKFGLDPIYLYTCAILVVLSLNILFSARAIRDPQALHLLGVTLLVISGTAFVLLAHYQQVFHPMLFASVVLLFMVVPIMPWGLREALVVTLPIYAMFTLSTMGGQIYFADQSVWTLQFIMIGTGVISLSLVARNVRLRKHDLITQHDLVVAHDRIADLSNRDPLTGAWNRRYFDADFEDYLKRCHDNLHQIQFMLIDVDDFKVINDNAGHESGDKILQFVARVFEGLIADNGCVVRMGGDEFAVIFSDLDPKVIAKRGLKILRQLTQDHSCEEVVNVHFSIGVASVPPEIEISYRQLYKQADMALYKAKTEKGSDLAMPNIVVSVLSDPDDIFISTQELWLVPKAGGGVSLEPVKRSGKG